MLSFRRSVPDPAHRRTASDEAGFSLIEVVVAMVILGLVASVIGALLVNTLGVSKDNTARTTAADLAASAIEKARAQRALDIPDGRVVTSVLVGATTFQVAQDAAYVNLDSSNACVAGGSLAYKRVTVTVTWPNMGTTQPVRSDTLRSLGFGSDDLSASKGAASVLVKDEASAGVAGIPVTLKSSPGLSVVTTLTTGEDGCVVFADVAPGTYVATMDLVGYVDLDGFQAETSASFSVTAATLSTTAVQYDRYGALTTNLVPPAGYAVPAALGATLQTSRWAAPTTRAYPDCTGFAAAPQGCVSGTPPTRTAARLFPGAYTAWAGTCNDSAPAVLASLVTVVSGAAPALDAPLAGVDISTGYVTTGVPATGTVYAIHMADGGRCPTGVSVNLGNLPGIGVVSRVALPYGTWYIQRTNSTTSVTATQKVVLSAVGGPQSVTVR